MDQARKQSLDSLRRIVSSVVITSSPVLALLALFYIYTSQLSPLCLTDPQPNPTCNLPLPPSCGSSPAQATQAGCLFDTMNLAWQAPACHNSKLIREFSDSNQSGIFGSQDARRALQLTGNEASQAALVHVSRDFLRRQCKYRWTELTQALLNGGPVHGLLRDEIWTLSCEEVLLDDGPQEKNTRLFPVAVTYPNCVF